jgi:membrane associated rhomboid family serine protease
VSDQNVTAFEPAVARPWLTWAVMLVTAATGVAQLRYPPVFHWFNRDPVEIADGQWWRLITANFVQDGWAPGLAFNLSMLALVGAGAEMMFGRWRWAVIYASSGVFGQILTNVLDATMGRGNSAGNSMANFGLLGAVAVTVLSARGRFRGTAARAVRPLTVPAILVLLGGVYLCAIANQHGPTLLFGAALGIVLKCADRPR